MRHLARWRECDICRGYQRLDVVVPAGAASSVVVFGGVWTDAGDTWLQLDDVTLLPA